MDGPPARPAGAAAREVAPALQEVGQLAAQVDVGPLAERYQEAAVDAAVFVGVLATIYLVGRVLVIPPVVRAIRARNPHNATLVGAAEQYLKVAFFLLALPIATSAADYGVFSGSALVIAAGTLALGVAGQQVIGNLVSGVFLVADPDFNVGDYIEWGDNAGTVERIALRVTRVRTPAEESITVPNTQLATSAVHNPYSGRRYRVSETLSVSYEEDLGTVRSLLAETAAGFDRVVDDPEPVVQVVALGDTSVGLEAMFWVRHPRPDDVSELRSAFNAAAVERLRDAGVDLSPPTDHHLSGSLDVHGDGTPGSEPPTETEAGRDPDP